MNFFHMPNTRLAAFFTHMGISTLLLFILSYIVYFIWFPGALTFASGGLDGMQIVVLVDMVLGPLLTLVIYNIKKSKKELVIDLSLIAALQLSCLTMGMFMVYQQRPLVIVHENNVFYAHNSRELKTNNIDISSLDKFSGPYPKIIIKKPPQEVTVPNQDSISSALISIDALWQDVPVDISERIRLFSGGGAEIDGDCLDKAIIIEGRSGVVCFSPETLQFSDYRSD